MEPSEDERILAALAHASIVANIVNLAGVIATALIWTSQRERSEYVNKHALQSLIYQGIVLVCLIALMLFWGVCLAFSLLPAVVRPDLYRSSPPNSFWIALLGLALPIGFSILATLYGLYGAYRVYHGKPFRYPLAGRFARLEMPAKPARPAAPTTAPANLVVPEPIEEPQAAEPKPPAGEQAE